MPKNAMGREASNFRCRVLSHKPALIKQKWHFDIGKIDVENGLSSFVFKRGMFAKPVIIFLKYDNTMQNISAADIHCVIFWIPF